VWERRPHSLLQGHDCSLCSSPSVIGPHLFQMYTVPVRIQVNEHNHDCHSDANAPTPYIVKSILSFPFVLTSAVRSHTHILPPIDFHWSRRGVRKSNIKASAVIATKVTLELNAVEDYSVLCISRRMGSHCRTMKPGVM